MYLVKQQDYSIHIEDMCLQVLLDVDHEKHVHPEESVIRDNINITMHSHFFSELFICESGSIEIKTTEGILPLYAGDILVMPAEVEHVKLPSPAEVHWKSICFSCYKRQVRNCEKFYRRFQRLLSGHRPFIVCNHPELSHRIFHLLQRISEDKLQFFSLELANLLAYMIEYDTDEVPSSFGIQASYNMDLNRISRLEQLIATQFSQDLKAEDVAAQFYISARQLDRICRKRYGATFRQAVINRRLQVAIEMFETTQMTIEEIGIAVGFHSRTSFFRAFSAQYGVSPNHYRKQYSSDRRRLP